MLWNLEGRSIWYITNELHLKPYEVESNIDEMLCILRKRVGNKRFLKTLFRKYFINLKRTIRRYIMQNFERYTTRTSTNFKENILLRGGCTIGAAICQLADYEESGYTPKCEKLAHADMYTWRCSSGGYVDTGLRMGITEIDAIHRLAEYEDSYMTPDDYKRI